MADMMDLGSFDLAAELSEAQFYLNKKMYDEAREVLERAYHFMPYHKKVREALENFRQITGEQIGGDAAEEAEIAEPEPEAPQPQPKAPPKPAAATAAQPAPAAEATATSSTTTATAATSTGPIDTEEELYDARFYFENEMYKDSLLCLKKVLSIEPKNTEARELIVEIKKRLKK